MEKTNKRIAAIIGLVLIALLIISFIASAFIGSSKLFQSLLFCIWAIPILLWVCIWSYGKLVNKSTIADLFPETEEERQIKEEALRASKGLSPKPESFTDEELTEAMQNEQKSK